MQDELNQLKSSLNQIEIQLKDQQNLLSMKEQAINQLEEQLNQNKAILKDTENRYGIKYMDVYTLLGTVSDEKLAGLKFGELVNCAIFAKLYSPIAKISLISRHISNSG